MLRLRNIYFLLVVGACASFLVASWDAVTGGFHVQLLGVRISSWEIYKPLRAGAICAALAFWIHDRGVEFRDTSWAGLDRRAGIIAAGIALLVTAITAYFGIHVAGGADGYGYVSQASLWASGRIMAANRLAALVPDLGGAVAPLGYRLAQTPGYLAPVYSPGLPLVMAALKLVGLSVYAVTPLAAGAVIWLTFRLATRVADRRTGAIAAAMLSFSPIFVLQALLPMSDVPATAWWMLAWVFAASAGRWTALAAGAASSAAILTRPNIVVVAIVLATFIAARSGLRRAAVYCLGILPSTIVVAALNRYLYGSTLASGYGTLDQLFSVQYFTTNVARFWMWLADLHTPLVSVGILALASGRVKGGWWFFAFLVALLGCYAFYIPFDDWTFLRFLLPGLPILFVFDASIGVTALERLPIAIRGAAVFALCTLVPLWFVAKIEQLNLFDLEQGERRYRTVGEAVGRIVPPDAVVISLIHSGSLRFYGDRATIRYDFIEPDRLDAAVAIVRAHGLSPYFLVEDWEEPHVRERFGRLNLLGQLDWPPRAEYLGRARVRLYAPEDRERYLRGDRLLPLMIPSP